jgi:hypothetical protein
MTTVAPHILVRPVDRDNDAAADCYVSLLAGATGCHLLLDERLDHPAELPVLALPNRLSAWQRAIRLALQDFHATLAQGAETRKAALALPAVEEAAPPWSIVARPSSHTRQAAE